MIMVICNEERFLREHLLYHHAIGIDRAYLFFDRCTDRSIEIARTFPWVRSFDLDRKERESLHFVSELHRPAMDYCLQISRKEGMDWLLVIDPDEFAYGDNLGLPDEAPLGDLWNDANLKTLLSNQPDDVDQVRLATREILPALELDGQPFYHQVWFHGKPHYPFRITHPLTGESRVWQDSLGHLQGKAFVRTRCDVQGCDSHLFTANQGAPIEDRLIHEGLHTVRAGKHAHYFITSVDHWMDKYQKLGDEPSQWKSRNPVEFPKQTSKEVRARLSPVEAEAFCRRTFFLTRDQIDTARINGWAIEDRRFRRLIESVARTPSPAVPSGPEPEPIALIAESRQLHSSKEPEAYEDLSPQRLSPHRRSGFSKICSRNGMYFRRIETSACVKTEVHPGRYGIEVGVYPYGDVFNLFSLTIRIEGAEAGRVRKDWVKGTARIRIRVPPSDQLRPVSIHLYNRKILGKQWKCPIHFIHLTREPES